MIKQQSRRSLLKGAVKAAAAGSVALTAAASAQTTGSSPALEKKSHPIGPKPDKTPLFSSAISYGNLLFLAGIGAHFPGDIKSHTAHVMDELKKQLENAGSSMDKVLKVNVYLNDLKDYAGMNEVFQGKFGTVPPVRTTVSPAGGIPGNSLVEIDCIAYI